MKHSTALKRALKLIRDENEEFVCHAIWYATGDDFHPLIKQIENAFKKDEVQAGSTVISWLRKKGFINDENYFEYTKYHILKDYRIRWLKNWIKELEAKGE